MTKGWARMTFDSMNEGWLLMNEYVRVSMTIWGMTLCESVWMTIDEYRMTTNEYWWMVDDYNDECLHGNTILHFQTKGLRMVLILDGNSEHVAHAWRKISLSGEINPICDCSRSNQMFYIRSNYRDCSSSAHLFPSYHLIYLST